MRNLRISVLIIAAALLPTVPLAQVAGSQASKTAVANLSDERFEVRERAAKTLWELGLEGIPFLEASEQAVTDPEQRLRLSEIRRHLSRGFIPGLGQDLLKQVQAFHQGERFAAISGLLTAEDDQGPVIAELLVASSFEPGSDEEHALIEFASHRVREKAWPLMKDGDKEASLRLFERAYQFVKPRLENHPDEANTWNGFAWDCALSRTHLDEGLEAVDHAIKVGSDHRLLTTFLDTKAEILFVNGDRKGAQKWIEKAIRMRPQLDPEYYIKQRKRFLYSDFKSLPDYE